MDIFTKRFNEVLNFEQANQSSLANQIGIARQCITDYKSGKSFPAIETLAGICSALEVSSDYLLGLSDDFGTPSATPMHDSASLTEKEKALLKAFKNMLPETQDFVLRTAQSLSDTDSVKTLK